MFHKKFYNIINILIFIIIFVLIFAENYKKINENHQSDIPSAPILTNNFKCNEPEKEFSAGTEENPQASAQFRYEMINGNQPNADLQKLRRDAIDYTKNNIKNYNSNGDYGGSWISLGPGNIGGRIRSIIINPANTNQLLVGGVSGGIWKTTNGGLNWSAKLDGGDPISIGSMVIDPVNSSIVYAGTGEGWFNIDAVYGGGIYKSTDFGDNWTILSSTTGASASSFRNVVKMAADPTGNIYAATKNYQAAGGIGSYTTAGGLFKSADGGSTWTKISSTSTATNYFNPTDVIPISSSVILFATNSNGATFGGIYKTTDGGSNWVLLSSGLAASGYGRIALCKDPVTSTTIYAVFESTNISAGGDGGLKGIYKSTNSGDSWSALTRPPALTSTGSLSYLSAQGWYDNVIAVNPFNTSHIYAGGVEMVKTTNGGTSWFQLTYWNTFYGTPYVHADEHVIAFDPVTSGVVYSGNDGGIYKSTNNGSNWTSLNNGLEISQFYGGAVYPSGTTYYGGTQDNGHLKYDGSGTTWTLSESGDGGYAAQDQTNSSISYEEYVYLQISKTVNGGSSWSSCTSGLTDAGNSANCLFIAPFAMNPENSAVLIAGSDNVWVTSNSAGSWTSSSSTLSSGAIVSAVTIDNSSANYLGFAGTTDGKVFKCTSLNPAAGIDTWTDITPTGNNGAWVRRVVVDLTNKNNIYACYSGYNTSGTLASRHIWRSTNQGTSWTDISLSLPNVPVHSLVINPFFISELIIGTETGVYHSTDIGTSWTTLNSGMASYVPVDELVYQTGTSKLFAFTHGRSAYITDTPLPVTLMYFTNQTNGRDVTLRWETSFEINNKGFDIERKNKTDDQWQKIGFVEGHGNSTQPNAYAFKDSGLNSGSYNYRLKQIDYNGAFEYYSLNNIVTISAPTDFTVSQNYPNPSNPSSKIDYRIPFDGMVSIKVYNITGQEVTTLFHEFNRAGYYTVKFDGTNFASGVYFYTLRAEGSGNMYNKTMKMVVVK